MTNKIRTFVFELTNKCNEHCDFCYSMSYQPRGTPQKCIGQLSGTDWIKGLKNIVQYGAKSVDFSGGEPTFHREFLDILSYAKSKNLQTIVSTNGSTYNNIAIRNALVEYANCISISLHGANPKTHDAVKKRIGSYELALASIKHYSTRTQVKVNTVACQENIKSIANIGKVLDINHNNIIWKISKALLQAAGAYNIAKVEISENLFSKAENAISSRYLQAYNEKRILFRRPSESMEPYVIVRSDGTLHIPSGESSISLNIKITDKDMGKLLESKLNQITGDKDVFADKLAQNHLASYSRLERRLK